MKASDNRTPDHGRTIGNGVVLAYGGAAVSLTAMVLAGYMPWHWATGLIAAMFAFVMGDDYVIQTRDMESSGEYQTQRERRDGTAETTDDESGPVRHENADDPIADGGRRWVESDRPDGRGYWEDAE